MLNDVPAPLEIPAPAPLKRNINDVKGYLGCVMNWFSPARFALLRLDVKLLVVSGVFITLLLAMGAIALSTIQYSQRDFDLFNVTTTYVNEVERVHRMVNDLELLERRYSLIGEDQDLRRSKIMRRQMAASLEWLDRQPYGELISTTPVPRLKTRSRAEPATPVGDMRLRHTVGPYPASIQQQVYAEKETLNVLRVQLSAMHDAAMLTLAEHLNIHKQRQSELILASAGTAAGAVVLLLVLWSFIRSNLVADSQLRDANRDLVLDAGRQLTAAAPAADDVAPIIKAARAAERADIARDIHDELGALLMAIKIDLKCSSTNTTTSRRAVDSQWPVMLNRVNAAMDTVARIASELRPRVVEKIGLWPAIESYAREFEEVARIPCHLRMEIDQLPSLYGEVACDIFRIVQEILTNVARHAEARLVDIQIGVENAYLKIEVTDNGKGINPDQILGSQSQGLAGMVERAQRLGGELYIHGQPESGTKLALRVPITAFQ